MSHHSYRGSDNALSANGSSSFRSQSNSVSKLSTGSSSSIRFESLSLEHFRLVSENAMANLPTSPTSQGVNNSNGTSLDPRKSITKERLLAYSLYVDDINFVKDQRNYLLGVGGVQDLSQVQTLLPENFNVPVNIVPGYTLLHRLSSTVSESLTFAATNDYTGNQHILRLSPDLSESDHIARFVNDWYLTLGLNPPSRPRLWTNRDIISDYVASPATERLLEASELKALEEKHSYSEWEKPITLPQNIPGILYPIDAFNVFNRKELPPSRRMAMVYPNCHYVPIREYYQEKAKALYNNAAERTSIHSGSVKSVLSELSEGIDANSDRILLTNNLGSGEFDDLSNRVKQIPKTPELVSEILRDMIEALHALTSCHELGIVHNGITSHNILRSKATAQQVLDANLNRVVLTGFDFGFSVVYEDSFHAFRKKNLRAIDDLLPYMSPENTGDAISLVNFSTDIYSVGIVLYEMIVGCLPFQSDNPVRLRKMHLSQKPIQPIILGKNWISERLNNLIMKCLEKKPQDRYISTAQLQQDLRQTLKEYEDHCDGPSAPEPAQMNDSGLDGTGFTAVKKSSPGFFDRMFNNLSINTKPTQSELSPDTPLLDTFPVKMQRIPVRDRIMEFNDQNLQLSKMIIVKGGSGVGKTTIIEEMAGQAISRYDFVVPWTYDCSDMNVTKYGSLIYGIHTITRQILSSSSENISEWRQRFTNEIDTDLSVLFQAVPDLKLLLGPHYQNVREDRAANNGFRSGTLRSIIPLRNLLKDDADLESFVPREEQLNLVDEQALSLELRYKYIFKKFYGLIAERGLTVVLDDFQWCSKTELLLVFEILDYIRSMSKKHVVSIFASYHSSEAVSHFENKRVELEYLEKMALQLEVVYKEFEVTDLDLNEFSEFLTSFSLTKSIVSDSTTVNNLFDITYGNRLSFSYLSRYYKLKNQASNIGWNTILSYAKNKDQKKLLLQLLIDDIIESYLKEVGSEKMMRLLKFAAIICVNGLFKMSDLMIVTGFSLLEAHEILQLCMETKLIIPSGIYYKMPFHLIASNRFPFDLDDSTAWNWTAQTRYRFDHNVIHFNLLKQLEVTEEFQDYHRLAGLRLYKSLAQDQGANVSDFLSMASHVLMSCDVAREKDLENYYDALVTGGRYAIATSNLPLALKFFRASMKFIPAHDGARNLKAALTCIQCCYLLKDFDECVRLILVAEEDFGKDNWILIHMKVRLLFNSRQFKRGIKKAIRALQALDVEAYLSEEQCKPVAEKHFNQLPLSVNEIRVLKTLNKATDPKFVLTAELILDVLSPTYVLGLTELRRALLAQLVHLMLKHGYTNACGVPLIHLANMFVLSLELMSIVKACELTDVALSLVNSNMGSSSEFSEQLNETYITLMAPFKQPLNELMRYSTSLNFDTKTAIKPLEASLPLLTINSLLLLGYVTGWTSLSQALQKPVELTTKIERTCHNNSVRLWVNQSLIEEYLDLYKKLLPELTPDLEFCYLGSAVLWCATVGRFNEGAEIILDRAYHVLKKLPMSLMHVRVFFFSAICLCFNTAEFNHKRGMELARKISKLFEMWSELCYQNVGPELKIINICISACTSKALSLSILDLFEEAILAAKAEGKWLELALANHACAAWLLRTSDSKKRAFQYANEAYSIHKMMNLDAQADRLKSQFLELFDSFNWAGVAKVPETSRLRVGVSKAFSDDLILTFLDPPDYSPITEDSIDFTDRENEPTKPKDFSVAGTNTILANAESRPAIPIGNLLARSTPLSRNLSQKLPSSLSSDKSTLEPTQEDWVQAIRLCLSILQSSNIDAIVLKLLESCLTFSGVDYGAVVLNIQTDEPMVKAIGTVNNIYKLDDELLISRADLVPYLLIIECFLKGERINKEDNRKFFEEKFGKDSYYSQNICSSVLCIPIKTSTVIGAVYLERQNRQLNMAEQNNVFDSSKVDLLELLCSQAAVSFSKLVVYNQMELAKKAAEEATEEKASFLANMSHEIRTPFNSLFACSIFLLDTKLTPTQREYVETIKNSALVTLNIIDGILAFSKIEHGSFSLENKPFSINDSMESSISILSDQIQSKDIEFAYFNKCPEIDLIYGDATRVRQIIINLVGNALKFTNLGFVKVTLTAERIRELRYEICISVEDTGIGIPEASKLKIFGAFSQVDGSLKRVHGGSGLGLAISKKLAELMNGRITFRSEFGKGSTFEFHCPFEVQLHQSKPLVKPQTVCMVLEATLKKQALRQVIEHYGAKAIDFRCIEDVVASGEDYDVLLLDARTLKPGQKVRSTIKKNATIYLIVRFGLHISDTITSDLEVDLLLFLPINRSTTIKILEHSLLKEAAREEDAPEEEVEVYPLSILLAEDNPINLRVASQHLKKLGYLADHAKDGVQALEKCEEKLNKGQKYDVILMDIQMPRKDGIEAAIELQQSFAERNCLDFLPQIVALTANVAGEDREKCLKCGMVDFVSKPILPEELKRVLTNVAEKIKNKGRS